MKFGSLFSGVGGLDLGLEAAGWECLWQVEFDDFCNKILEMRFPHTKKYGDIKDVRTEELERVDAIVGGFPCQPVSFAGRQEGEGDERWLWPDFMRIITDLRPSFAVIENVVGLLHHGGATVLNDLAKAGYDAEWYTIPASAFGADHKRERIFIVAYHTSLGVEGVWPDGIEVPRALFEEVLSVRDSNGQWKSEPDLRRTADGVSDWVDRLRALGNAVVPQIAYWIGECINECVDKQERKARPSQIG